MTGAICYLLKSSLRRDEAQLNTTTHLLISLDLLG